MPQLLTASVRARVRKAPVPVDPPLRYVPVAIFTFGLCHYGAKTPYKTVDVFEDSKHRAAVEAWRKLTPTVCERVIHLSTRSNPEYVASREQYAMA